MQTSKLINLLAQSLLLFALISVAKGKIIYVDDDANGLNDGTSWQNAYNYLQDALADANSSQKLVEIRVAQGVYKPDQGGGQTPGDRTATFQLINNVTLKGGYAGFGQPDPNIRDIEAYKTILSGDLNGNDIVVTDPCDMPSEPTRAENSYCVVTGSGTDATAVLDGFTITAGLNDRYFCFEPGQCMPISYGAGMYNQNGSPTLRNCTLSGNSAFWGAHPYGGYGGGMFNDNSNPEVVNCTFSRNFAYIGGGMFNEESNPKLANCTFGGNQATKGGGMCNMWSSPPITNCTFIANSVQHRGGGMCNDSICNPRLTNCLFSDNSANEGGGICNLWDSSPTLTNCTFYKNSAMSTYGGGGMKTIDGSPSVTNCLFERNSASNGGAMYNNAYTGTASPSVTNCLFIDNSATGSGGAMYNYTSENLRTTIANCTFSRNSAVGGGAMYSRKGGSWDTIIVIVTNCIFWGDAPDEIRNENNPTVTVNYTDIQSGWTGECNINKDPCFAEPNNGDYHLKSQAGRWDANEGQWTTDKVTSLCIDAGDPSSDWTGELWPHGKRINMGAYGGTPQASMSLSDAGNIADLNNDDWVDYNDLKLFTDKWLYEVFLLSEDLDRDGRTNFEDFAIMAFHWLEEK
jgi:hypothetical protein